MPISILLRARNCEGELANFADRIRRGDQLIVVDNQSTDGTVAMAQQLGAEVVPYPRKRFSYGGAINLGIAASVNSWVLVMSPHCHPETTGFWDILERDLFQLPKTVVACQVEVALRASSAAPRGGITLFGPEDLGNGPWELFGNTCCAYRLEVLRDLPFDESLATAEDVDWCLRVVRAGHSVAVNRRLRVVYRNFAPLGRYWRRGRTDFPTVAMIYGIPFRPSPLGAIKDIIREFLLLAHGQIPFRLWTRMVVKRSAEFSLRFWPVKESHLRV